MEHNCHDLDLQENKTHAYTLFRDEEELTCEEGAIVILGHQLFTNRGRDVHLLNPLYLTLTFPPIIYCKHNLLFTST